MPSPGKIILILVLFSVVRGCATLVFGKFFEDLDARYFFGLLNYVIFCLLVVTLAAGLGNSRNVLKSAAPAVARGYISVSYAVGIGLLLFMFFLGEFALEVVLVSSFAPDFAYSYWHFRDTAPIVHPLLSVSVASYLVAGVIIGPFLEEVIFRILLLSAFLSKKNLLSSSVLTSLVFTIAHFSQPYLLTTFLFSLALCYLYAISRSLLMCAVAHGTFNLAAYLHQNYFDIQWTRSIDQLASLSDWIPQAWMFCISTVLIAVILVRVRRSSLYKEAVS